MADSYMLNTTDALLIFIAAFGAGIMNAIAGGGTFLTLPALVLIGVPTKIANATSSVALWPGNVASTIGYLPELRSQSGRGFYFAASALGGLVGALLLLVTEEATFAILIPWLMLVATVLFTAGPSLTRWLRRRTPHPRHNGRVVIGSIVAQFLIAVYGGFFGAGIGILMLAALALAGMEDLHQMNGLKNGLATAIKGVAVLTFVAMDLLPIPAVFPGEGINILLWPHLTVMVLGGILGGFAGVKLARKLPTRVTRGIITLVGTVLTAWFFYQTYA